MAEISSFYNEQTSYPNQLQGHSNLKSVFSKPQKIISSMIIEEEQESQKVFLALDLENYLYLWFLKGEVIEAVSLLDETENEEKKNLFPDLCFDISAFISEYFNYQKERRIFVSNFNYLANSNRKLIKVTGNFDSLLIESSCFITYLKSEFSKNQDLNKYECLLNDSASMLIHHGEENEFKCN